MECIARIHNDFPTKFGLPRQSGLAPALQSYIVFEPAYRAPEALRGLEGYSHIWLLWEFHQARRTEWSPTVRPPRLGGNARMGVFATRSPFRPNPIGLSCVRLEALEAAPGLGTVLRVSGADLMDGTPIFDIKPYLPFTDCHPEATGGFAAAHENDRVQVRFPPALQALVSPERLPALLEALAQDPRPAYQQDPGRVYGMPYAGLDVRFSVEADVLTVREIRPWQEENVADRLEFPHKAR